MQLTYNESRAICIQDPNAMGTPSGQDPFRSSFRAAAALAQAPAQAPQRVRPACLLPATWASAKYKLACTLSHVSCSSAVLLDSCCAWRAQAGIISLLAAMAAGQLTGVTAALLS